MRITREEWEDGSQGDREGAKCQLINVILDSDSPISVETEKTHLYRRSASGGFSMWRGETKKYKRRYYLWESRGIPKRMNILKKSRHIQRVRNISHPIRWDHDFLHLVVPAKSLDSSDGHIQPRCHQNTG
jgi:hypothetical protein